MKVIPIEIQEKIRSAAMSIVNSNSYLQPVEFLEVISVVASVAIEAVCKDKELCIATMVEAIRMYLAQIESTQARLH